MQTGGFHENGWESRNRRRHFRKPKKGVECIVAHMCRAPCRATRVAVHVSQQSSSESWVFQVQRPYPATPLLKGPVAPVALQLPGVSHVKLPLKGVALQGGVAATLASVALRCATVVECWISENHGNHGNDENHGTLGCKPRVPPKPGLHIPNVSGLPFCRTFVVMNFIVRAWILS